MDNFNNYNYDDNAIERKIDLSAQMTRVFGWMFIGLLITGFTAMFTATSEAMLRMIFTGRFTFFILLILELVFVVFISRRALEMDYGVAAAAFVIYSVLNGITLSVLFLVYTLSSIYLAFFMTAAFFGFMCIYGLVTKTDLTSLGSFLFMGLIGLIIVSVVNYFFNSSAVEWIVSIAGVAIFLGLTAYDSQKIKEISLYYTGTEKERNIAIVGALILYLDFVNLFLYVLRILGKRK
ncbi:MAG TPA: Bax inhibitor-1/YccA family protein [Acetivibrio clariflavus]|nr:Bax inhibitor-1/YccA family protein [Acetivibrio clariflavus]HPU41194.1 Bax inhibitor-1/YccA family protein [Acetivibrio clariflavus]